ncbi:MAG: Fe-S cluster assembly ATPase SufC [Bacilli bacterium]|nr:Fe-S cluster assembly ATPase SufC [Bacilli bacterium]
MLEIKHLDVKVKDEEQVILKDLSLNINSGEIHAIMGPNGTGKSTLSKVIMGHYKYEVTNGDIIFNNINIKDLTTDERARLGMFIAMQDPISIDGLNNSEFLKTAISETTKEKVSLFNFIKTLEKEMHNLKLDENMLKRSLNQGFSGGEKKKNEILQLKLLKPKFIILDEIDSGLDVDSLKIVCKNINNYLQKNKDTSILIITHYPRILEFIKPNYVHIMKDGNIVKTGDYSLAQKIEKDGYDSINEVKEEDNNA